MPVAINDATGQAIRLDTSGAWVPTKLAEHPQTGERLALDGDQWVSLGKPPVDVAGEIGAVGSGMDRTVAELLGMPVDIANAGLNYFGFGSEKPVGGSEWIKDRMGGVVDLANQVAGTGEKRSGREVIDAEAKTPTGRVATRVGQELVGTALPGIAALKIGKQVAGAAPTVRGAVRDALVGTSTADRVGMAGLAVASGTGAGLAQEAAPGSKLAELGGQLTGAGLGLGAGWLAGVGINLVKPFVSREAREAAAGMAARENISDPSTMARINQVPDELVQNSPLTSAMATRDPGLAQLERTLRAEAPGSFAPIDAARAAAQRAEINRQAPVGPGAEAVGAMARAEAARVEGEGAARVAAAAHGVERAVDQVGPGQGPVEAGGTIRREIGNSTVEVDGAQVPYGARAVAKAGEKNLWNKLDQNEDLALEVSGGRSAAQSVVREMSPSAKPMSGDAAGVIEAARNMGEVVRWRELQDLRSWASQTSSDLARAGDAVNQRRVDAVIRGLDADIARAAEGGADLPSGGGGPIGGGPRPSGGGRNALRESTEAGAIPGIERLISEGKPLSMSRDGEGNVLAGHGLGEDTFITLNLSSDEKKALTRANADYNLAETTAQRVAARQAEQDILVPAAQRAIAEHRGRRASGSAGGPAPAAPQRVYTPDGIGVETQWRLVDLAAPDAPVPSHTADFQPNPAYPAELQPRDRGRAASEAQVVKMANELNPERLGSGGVGDGAPIIGPDGVVESGNGRLLAIARAHKNGGAKSAEYRQWLESQGHDTSGMRAPALVRVRTTDLSPAERVKFTEGANSGPGLGLSATEQAAVDAGRLSDDALSLYRGGSVDDAANVDFARAFVKGSAPGEAGRLATAEGRLSIEGARRLQGALLHKVFGNDTGLVSSLLETGDDNIRALGRALTDAAPKLAQLRAAIARGEVPPEMDPVPALLDSVKVVQRARKSGDPIGDVLNQADAFNPVHPAAEDFLASAYGDNFRRVSAGRTRAALDAYVETAMESGGLFGTRSTPADAWRSARSRAGGIADDAGPAPGAAGPTVDPSGNESSRFGGAVPPAGGGAVPPAGAGAAGRGGGTVVDDGLTPNFGPEDRAAYRAAREATRERAETFDRGSVGQVLQKGGYRARGEDGYLMPVEQVAGKFFNGGKASDTDLQEFLRAAEGRPAAVQALQDFAVGDLRRVAVDDAGKVNPTKWANWMRQHSAALSSFPELRARFANVKAAQEVLDEAEGAAADAVKAFAKSAPGKFINADASKAFASVLNSADRTAGLRQLVRVARGDPEKLGALRRALVDELMKRIENTGAVTASGESTLSAAKTTSFLRELAEPLQKSGLMKREHVDALRKVEEDMRRKVFVDTVGRSVGSNTYQNMSSGAFLMQFTMGLVSRTNPVLATLGRPVAWLMRVPDAEVRQILIDAMADPKMMRLLLQRSEPDRMNWVGLALRRRAWALGITIPGQTTAEEPQRRAG